MNWGSLCSAHDGFWLKLTPGCRIAGTARPIPILKKAQTQNWALIFSDEASFRQDSTLYATWSRVGQPPEIPVTGQRKSVKILGAIELFQTRFHYRQETVFNASAYLCFLEATGRPVSAARRYPDPRQRLLPQRPRRLVLVRSQSTLAGSAPAAALLSRVQPDRTTLAIYAENRHPQPVFLPPLRIAGHPHSCLY